MANVLKHLAGKFDGISAYLHLSCVEINKESQLETRTNVNEIHRKFGGILIF